MNEGEAQPALIALWLEKADDALASAQLELEADHASFAVNRLYYACFYAVTALLLKDGKQFSRHSAVRAEFNRSYVKTGRVAKEWGRFYHGLFEDRQEGDYLATSTFDSGDVSARVQQAREFVDMIRGLLSSV